MKITILGSGASTGVPVIGCSCAVCASSNPKNKRLRASILVEYDNGFRLLVDTSPDLRQQALSINLDRIDTVIFTHAHADHTHGIDDLRPFNSKLNAAIPAYADAETLTELKRRFPFVFEEAVEGSYWKKTALQEHSISAGQKIHFTEGASCQVFTQIHGTGTTLGLKFGNIVYSTDLNAIPPESESYLHNLDLWILDCLRDGSAGSHLSLSGALELIEKYRPKRAILSHMNHELEYEALKTRLPQSIEPAYDGLTIS